MLTAVVDAPRTLLRSSTALPGALRSRLGATRLGERRARATSRSSHRHLLPPLDLTRWASPEARPGAIVVPTARGASEPRSGLSLAARLAADVGSPLVVLVSKDAATRESRARLEAQLAAAGAKLSDTLVLEVSPTATDLTTFKVDAMRISRENRRGGSVPGASVPVNDVGRKRNLAILLARSMGWESLLLLDDDVFVDENGRGKTVAPHARSLSVEALQASVAAVTEGACGAVGWTLREFDDNSVLFRIRHEMKHPQEQFIGAGALAFGVTERTPFFPAIYNEDWLFLLALLRDRWREGPWREAGDVHQDEYPAYPAGRAKAEEMGDLLGEGLLALVEPDGFRLRTGSRDHWRRAIAERIALRTDLVASVGKSEHAQRKAMLEALEAVGHFQDLVHRDEARWVSRITGFLAHWEVDLASWESRLATSAATDPMDLLAGAEITPGGAQVADGSQVEDFVREHRAKPA